MQPFICRLAKLIYRAYSSRMKIIADKISASGVSDKVIAEAIGMPISTVWRWRKGLTRPNIDNIAALARAIRCHPADLIPGEQQ